MRLIILATVALLPVLAVSAEPERACEASLPVLRSLQRLNSTNLEAHELDQTQRKIIKQLLAEYPDDLFVRLRDQEIENGRTLAERDTVIAQYRDEAARHPGNSTYQFLYAEALNGQNTPLAIQISQQIAQRDPNFAREHLLLADIYGWGKFVDHAKARRELDSFFTMCPATLDGRALSLAQNYGGPELAAKIVPALRKRLRNESDPQRLEQWRRVWTLEFKAHPVSEHERVRQEMANDLMRLQSVKTHSAAWLVFLRDGYHQAGNEAAAKHQQAELLKWYPHSVQTREALDESWAKTHPFPDSDPSKQKEYWAIALVHAEQNLKAWPHNELYLWNQFQALKHDDGTSTEQLTAAANDFLAEYRKAHDLLAAPPAEMQIAQEFVKRKVHSESIAELVQKGWATYQAYQKDHGDRAPGDWLANGRKVEAAVMCQGTLLLLDAARQSNRPEIAKANVAKVQALKLSDPYLKSFQWQVQAKWAELEGRRLDALLMYRAALDARPADYHAKDDELPGDLDRLRKELGGTDASIALLGRERKTTVASENGSWQKPQRAMNPWQLLDLTGKSWKLMSFKGKTLLINVWATWCGPCRAEHPRLEKLYQQLKGDPSIEIITFNVDDQIGDVAPYIKENYYTFPVLLAKDYADELMPVLSIPRNWIVDPQGKWEWEQTGFNTEEKWEANIVAKLKSVE